MNSADRQSLQFTMNKILFKIFGAMSKDTYSEVSKYFGIDPLEEVISVRRDTFLQRYCATDNYCSTPSCTGSMFRSESSISSE